MAKFYNATPHPITLIRRDGSKITIEPGELCIRVSEIIEPIGEIDGVEVISKKFTDIPEETIDKLKEICDEYDVVITSLLAYNYLKRKYECGDLPEYVFKKLYVIGRTVRDENGFIIGADAISQP